MTLLSKTIILISLSLFAFSSLYAQSEIIEQDLLLIEKLDISSSRSDNITVQIKLKSSNQKVANAINQTKVNSKQGFNAQFSDDNAILNLSFSQKFTRGELNILLAYCGIKLESTELSRLQNLLN